MRSFANVMVLWISAVRGNAPKVPITQHDIDASMTLIMVWAVKYYEWFL